jgi:restriction system protein
MKVSLRAQQGETLANTWMVRSSGGDRIVDFLKGYVAIGFDNIDLTRATTAEAIRALYEQSHSADKPGAVSSAIAMLRKFRLVMQVGDNVVTYDPGSRRYFIGTITSDYFYKPDLVGDLAQIREVRWSGEVPRDTLSVSARNSLGSVLTLFSVDDDVWDELVTASRNPAAAETQISDEKEELEETKHDTKIRAHELIKDKILRLDADEMEELAAAILRAMGFKTRVSPKGPDRGVDVLASPDGLGLQEPRIKVEVKHRSNAMGAPDIRAFLGGLRPGDRGMYVSTGGFTKEAKYEAERSNTPATLINLDELAHLVVMHYDSFDLEGRALIPLVKVYWPAE